MTEQAVALERLVEGVKELLATDWGLPHHIETGLEALLLAVEHSAVEQAAPEEERRFPNEHDAALRLTHDAMCEAGQKDGETFCVSGCACGERSLRDARAAIREAARIIADRTELMGETADDPLPDVKAWLALPAVQVAREEKR